MRPTAIPLVVLGALAFTAGSANARIPPPYQNCGQLNARHPHGVGKVGAQDTTSVMVSRPVTNFKRSTALYLRAMSFNKGLDPDHDGIACEKP